MRLLPRRSARPALFSALLALALYGVTLGGTYVYDDRYIVEADPRVDHPRRWGEYWTKDYFNGGPDNLYRPLVSMSYAIEWWIHGRGPNRAWLFHLVNWLLHAGVCACVAEFVRRIASYRVAVVTGLLYAAHPIHVEAVANIVGRAELACALGIMLALVFFVKRPLTRARAVAIWAAMVLALLSKEQGMLLPLAILAAVPLRRGEQRAEKQPALLLIVLLSWTLAGYIVFRESNLKFWWDRSFLDWTINPIILSRGMDRYLVPVAIFGRYIALLLAPARLTLDYGARVMMPTESWGDPYLYLGVISMIAFIVAFVVALVKRRLVVAYGILAFALFYSVISNMLTIIGVNFAERLMYIPSIFFLLLVGMALAQLRRTLLVGVMTAVVVLLSVRTVSYAALWNNRMALYSYTLAHQPQSLRLHLLLAEEYRLNHQYDRAEKVLAEARAMQPDYFKLWTDSAQNQYEKGDRVKALEFLIEAAKLRPTVRQTRMWRELVPLWSQLPTTRRE